VQQVLLDLARRPKGANFINAALRGTAVTRERLEKLGLIRKEGDHYAINFMLMTTEDMKRARAVAESEGRSLTSALLARREELEAAVKHYSLERVDRGALLYILLGCFALDWEGLSITADKGYRVTAKVHANGDVYVPWARQKNDVLQGLYWGSHNQYEPEVVLTSFGDHYALPRQALPDLLLATPARSSRELPASLRPKFAGAVQAMAAPTLRQLGAMMLALRTGEKSISELSKAAGLTVAEATPWLSVLEELEYVEKHGDRVAARIPILTEADRGMLERVKSIARPIVEGWLAAKYGPVKDQLAQITPFRSGVPYVEGFTEIWHYVFGEVNRQLVKAGLFADPYSANRRYRGFIAAVWQRSLEK